MDFNKTQAIVKQVRRDVVDLTYQAGTAGAHIGGSLSMVELLSVLYCDILHYDKSDMDSDNRDRVIFSKGHAAMALYAVLHRVGILPDDEAQSFRVDGSYIASHPHMSSTLGIEFSSGSLGLGLSQAVGVSLGLRLKGNTSSKIYVIMGDGECDEGSVWEAAMSASNYNLQNLVVILDNNELQLDGRTDDIMKLGNLKAKWESFGWKVVDIDGHDIRDIYESISAELKVQTQPLVIMAHTIKGKGVSFIENQPQWHVGMLNEKLYNKAIEELEANA